MGWVFPKEKAAMMGSKKPTQTSSFESTPEYTRRAVVKAGLGVMALAAFAGVAGCTLKESEADMALNPENKRIDWETYAGKDPQWWRSQESKALADRLVSYQQPDGGWRKTMEEEVKDEWALSTIDNGATWGQIRYLAKIYTVTSDQKYRESCVRGIEFLLANQHESGGWPQIPGTDGTYHAHITFNDDATTEVMRLMGDVGAQSEAEGFVWVEDALARRAGESFQKALRFTLDSQVVIDGTLCVWCQQYDEINLEPAAGRKYEPAALSTWESVSIVKFLKTQPDGDPEILRAVDAAMAWFDDVKLQGLRYERDGTDGRLVQGNPDDFLWARFYDLDTNTPIFGDKDGKVYDDVSKISQERRAGYDWYGTWPLELL